MGVIKTKFLDASSKRKRHLERKLLDACVKKDVRQVKKLLDMGVPPDVRMDKDRDKHCRSALMLLPYDMLGKRLFSRAKFSKDQEEIVRLLLEFGANLETTDAKGYYTIHHFVKNDYTNLLVVLLDYNVKLNVRAHTSLQQCPLHEAHNPHVVDFLVNASASVNCTDAKGYTPLHLSIFGRNTNIAMMQTLLVNGANPNIRNRHGKTPLHYVYHSYEKSKRSLPPYGEDKLLLQYGANPNVKDIHGIVPFAYYVYRAKPYDLLCSFKVNIQAGLAVENVINDMGPVLKALCKVRNTNVMELIIQSGYRFDRNVCTLWQDFLTPELMCFFINVDQVLPLRRIAANVIRVNLFPNSLTSVCALHLPTMLKEYIVFHQYC